jgi:hypothetical protein
MRGARSEEIPHGLFRSRSSAGRAWRRLGSARVTIAPLMAKRYQRRYSLLIGAVGIRKILGHQLSLLPILEPNTEGEQHKENDTNQSAMVDRSAQSHREKPV